MTIGGRPAGDSGTAVAAFQAASSAPSARNCTAGARATAARTRDTGLLPASPQLAPAGLPDAAVGLIVGAARDLHAHAPLRRRGVRQVETDGVEREQPRAVPGDAEARLLDAANGAVGIVIHVVGAGCALDHRARRQGRGID